MKIFRLEQIDESMAAKILPLYIQAGWTKEYSQIEIANLRNSLQNSFCVFCAEQNGEIVGIFRALSDGVSDAYLLDLYVENSHRNCGVATNLCRNILQYLKAKNIEWITCISTPEGEFVYKKFGSEMKGHIPYKF